MGWADIGLALRAEKSIVAIVTSGRSLDFADRLCGKHRLLLRGWKIDRCFGPTCSGLDQRVAFFRPITKRIKPFPFRAFL